MHDIVYPLLSRKGAFRVKIHYSSSQSTCWFADDACRYRVCVKEEVTDPGFIDQLQDCSLKHLQPVIDPEDTTAILNEFKRLRTTDQTSCLRNGSVNLINGMIGMTFSCDGAHDIDHMTLFHKLGNFATEQDICES